MNLNLYPTITPKPKRELSKSPVASSPNPISKRPSSNQILNSNNLHPKLRSTPKPNIIVPPETSTFKNIEDHVEGIKNMVEEAFNIKPKAKTPTKLKKKIRPYRPPGGGTPRPVLIRPATATPATPFTPTFKSSDRRATASPTPSPFTPSAFKTWSDRRKATASPTPRPRRPPTTPFAPYKAPTKTLQPYRPKPEPNFDHRPPVLPVKNSEITRVNIPNYESNQFKEQHPVPVKHPQVFRQNPENQNFDRQIPPATKNRTPESNYGSGSQNERINPVPVSVNRPEIVKRPSQHQQSYTDSNQNDNFARAPKQFENPYTLEKNVVIPQNQNTNWAEPRNDNLEQQDLDEITDEELLIQMAAGLELGKLK